MQAQDSSSSLGFVVLCVLILFLGSCGPDLTYHDATCSILTDLERVQLRTKREVSVSVISSYVRTTFSSPLWTSEHTQPPVWSTPVMEAVVEVASTSCGDKIGDVLELQDCSDSDLWTAVPER